MTGQERVIGGRGVRNIVGAGVLGQGSGLLILIISSGRDPLHGPAAADRISWSVLPRQHPRQ